MKCKNCGQENPREARYCEFCQQELVERYPAKLFERRGIIAGLFVVVVCLAAGFWIYRAGMSAGVSDYVDENHEHVWKAANCESPKTCKICGETSGVKSHSWSEATCLAPRTCGRCGLTLGTKGMHSWKEATVDFPETCSVCGETRGSALGNQQPTIELSVDDVIRERLPIVTYAMSEAEKVYSYSDSTLTRQTKQYYFNSQTDEIVILDISEDGSAVYVRYPSTISGMGYRDCWFAAEDILGELEPAVSEYVADTKIKTYKWLHGSLDVELSIYDMIPAGTKITSLGEHIYAELIIYSLPQSEWILDTVVTERMALTSPYDKPNELVADEYETFWDYLDYRYARPDKVLTKDWEEGGIKIGFLSRRELYFELTDSYMSGHPSTSESVPLTSVVFSADQNDRTGFTFTFFMQDQLQFEIYFTNADGERERSLPYSDVQGYYSDGCVTMYLALEENMPWDVYDLTSISVGTHQNKVVPEEHIVTHGTKTVEIHEDYIRKIQSEQHYFSALDTQGNVLWTHITQERQDRGQMSGIKYIGYINDLVLYDDNDTIVALDAETGKQLWKKSDFEGVINGWDVAMDGTLYFSGSYAPDLFIVSENGKLIKKVVELDGIDEKYQYVNTISAYDDHLIVGVAQYWDGWEQKYRVDLKDYSCTQITTP